MSTELRTTQILHGNTSLADVLEQKIGVVADFATTWDPPAVSPSTAITQSFSVADAIVGDFVDVAFTQPLAGCILSGHVNTAGQVTINLFNPTGSTVNLAGGTIKARLTRSA